MINFENVTKKYATGTIALFEVSLAIDKGEFVFIVGSTGSGKTTLLKLLIRELTPSEGKITISELDLQSLSKNKIPILRKKIGMVFQDLKLLNDRTVFENVLLPLEVAGLNSEEITRKVDEILGKVGLLEHRDKFPIQLSGGELQRTAIARALVLSPEILLADEPTGNLDDATSWEIVKLLSDINKEGTTVLMATHNADIVKSMKKRIVHIEKGKIVKDDKNEDHKKEHVKEEKKDEDSKKDEEKEEKKEEKK